MRTVYEREIANAAKIERRFVQGTESLCSVAFARAWKGVFPVKAAEELAVRAGCTVRAAAYQLSGEHEPSSRALHALVAACIPDKK